MSLYDLHSTRTQRTRSTTADLRDKAAPSSSTCSSSSVRASMCTFEGVAWEITRETSEQQRSRVHLIGHCLSCESTDVLYMRPSSFDDDEYGEGRKPLTSRR